MKGTNGLSINTSMAASSVVGKWQALLAGVSSHCTKLNKAAHTTSLALVVAQNVSTRF
jgi:hypothetical protein